MRAGIGGRRQGTLIHAKAGGLATPRPFVPRPFGCRHSPRRDSAQVSSVKCAASSRDAAARLRAVRGRQAVCRLGLPNSLGASCGRPSAGSRSQRRLGAVRKSADGSRHRPCGRERLRGDTARHAPTVRSRSQAVTSSASLSRFATSSALLQSLVPFSPSLRGTSMGERGDTMQQT